MQRADLLARPGASQIRGAPTLGQGSLIATGFEVALLVLGGWAIHSGFYGWLSTASGLSTWVALLVFANVAALVLALLGIPRDRHRHLAATALVLASVSFLLKLYVVFAAFTGGELY